MRITIARLRQGILILAGLLVVILIGFFAYARYRLHHFEKDLPGRLGVNIQQTANGYTYSQSSKGHTLFTVHASRLVQYKQRGNATLHDVSITLYGPAGSNRVDKIYGADFDYDAKNQVISAQGIVNIDLQGFGIGSMSPQNRIHVTTSGLVFNQKTGQADTSQHTEFEFPKASGSSTGAHYNSKTGVLILDSQVELTTTANSNPAVVRASHAQIVRDSNQAFLLNPQTEYQSENGSADTAIVDFRQDGSAQSINAQGDVRIVTQDGAVLTASNALTQLDEKSHPTQTDVGGGVNFTSKTTDESMHGTAVSGTLTFGNDSRLKHAQFRDDVSFVDQVSRLANDPDGAASRQIQASKLDVDFIPSPDDKKAIPQKALATGNASVNLHTVPSKGPQLLTTIGGDQLLALFTADGRAIRQLNGAGHTKIVDVAKDGSINTSSGDRLEVTFNTSPAGSKTGPKKQKDASTTAQASQIETATQDGHVILTQTPQKKAGAPNPATLTAWAQHAQYHASDQILHLTGNPRLYDGQALQMAAMRIDYHRDTEDASAAGDVKATYTQRKEQKGAPAETGGPALGGDGPIHITADHALLRRATNVSSFYGSDSGSGAGSTVARMWQGANSIQAPVLELTRTPQTLKAYGLPGSTAAVVNADFTSAAGANHQQSVVTVHSQTLFYSDAGRRGDFHGRVTAEDPDGVIRSDEAQVYLTPDLKGANRGQGNQQTQGQQTQVERIVANGRVVITQPGRKGVGEKLVYTADNGRYVLTGSPGHAPYLQDAAKGTTTGATLIFNSQDDSVVVSGGQSSAVTETRTPK
jgi:lipopolysaccharide export system protein LptA